MGNTRSVNQESRVFWKRNPESSNGEEDIEFQMITSEDIQKREGSWEDSCPRTEEKNFFPDQNIGASCPKFTEVCSEEREDDSITSLTKAVDFSKNTENDSDLRKERECDSNTHEREQDSSYVYGKASTLDRKANLKRKSAKKTSPAVEKVSPVHSDTFFLRQNFTIDGTRRKNRRVPPWPTATAPTANSMLPLGRFQTFQDAQAYTRSRSALGCNRVVLTAHQYARLALCYLPETVAQMSLSGFGIPDSSYDIEEWFRRNSLVIPFAGERSTLILERETVGETFLSLRLQLENCNNVLLRGTVSIGITDDRYIHGSLPRSLENAEYPAGNEMSNVAIMHQAEASQTLQLDWFCREGMFQSTPSFQTSVNLPELLFTAFKRTLVKETPSERHYSEMNRIICLFSGSSAAEANTNDSSLVLPGRLRRSGNCEMHDFALPRRIKRGIDNSDGVHQKTITKELRQESCDLKEDTLPKIPPIPDNRHTWFSGNGNFRRKSRKQAVGTAHDKENPRDIKLRLPQEPAASSLCDENQRRWCRAKNTGKEIGNTDPKCCRRDSWRSNLLDFRNACFVDDCLPLRTSSASRCPREAEESVSNCLRQHKKRTAPSKCQTEYGKKGFFKAGMPEEMAGFTMPFAKTMCCQNIEETCEFPHEVTKIVHATVYERATISQETGSTVHCADAIINSESKDQGVVRKAMQVPAKHSRGRTERFHRLQKIFRRLRNFFKCRGASCLCCKKNSEAHEQSTGSCIAY